MERLPKWLLVAVTPLIVFTAIVAIVDKTASIFDLNLGVRSAYIAAALISIAWTYYVWTATVPATIQDGRSKPRYPISARLMSTGSLVALIIVNVSIFLPKPIFGIDIYFDPIFARDPEGTVYVNRMFDGTGIEVALMAMDEPPPEVIDAEYRRIAYAKDVPTGLPSYYGRIARIWVVSTRLSGKSAPNLLNTSGARGAFVTTYLIDNDYLSMNSETVGRYIAVSATLRALQVLIAPETVFERRNTEAATGCLFDYHDLRETFVLLAQEPRFCSRERARLIKLLGEARVTSVEKLFANVKATHNRKGPLSAE
jgi:hypothetical protein